ncbi:hypothetical protein Busp01_43680 [Trinickia caryophylli]|nr:hypothetical protein Busp01_43680 [Trinickia caryophylli]
MQLLEQLDRLLGANVVVFCGHLEDALGAKSRPACDSLQNNKDNRVSLPKTTGFGRKYPSQERFVLLRVLPRIGAIAPTGRGTRRIAHRARLASRGRSMTPRDGAGGMKARGESTNPA